MRLENENESLMALEERAASMMEENARLAQSARKAEDVGNQRSAEVLRWKAEAKRMASTVAKAQADLRIRDERVSKMKRMVEDSENQVMERKVGDGPRRVVLKSGP